MWRKVRIPSVIHLTPWQTVIFGAFGTATVMTVVATVCMPGFQPLTLAGLGRFFGVGLFGIVLFSPFALAEWFYKSGLAERYAQPLFYCDYGASALAMFAMFGLGVAHQMNLDGLFGACFLVLFLSILAKVFIVTVYELHDKEDGDDEEEYPPLEFPPPAHSPVPCSPVDRPPALLVGERLPSEKGDERVDAVAVQGR